MDVNTNEVEAYKYVTQDDLKQLIKEADEAEAAGNTEGVKLTPWFRLIANTFLFKCTQPQALLHKRQQNNFELLGRVEQHR